ncbi:MAG: hypothetical protein ACTHOL_18395 [Luteibacter jiangsuensis]
MSHGIHADTTLHGSDLRIVVGEALAHLLGQAVDLLLLFLVVGTEFGDGGVEIGLLDVSMASSEGDRQQA